MPVSRCSRELEWLGGARVGLLICADIEVPDGADAAVAAGANLLLVIACTYVPTYPSVLSAYTSGKTDVEAPAWLGAVAHAAHHGVFVAYCNQARGMATGMSHEALATGAALLDTATFQGGGTRVVSYDGRDVAAVADEGPPGQGTILYATLGCRPVDRLGWCGAAMNDHLRCLNGMVRAIAKTADEVGHVQLDEAGKTTPSPQSVSVT